MANKNYERDKRILVKAAYKLTNFHIYPTKTKMRVKLATQIFRYSIHVCKSLHIY